jgi:hypothetical protein
MPHDTLVHDALRQLDEMDRAVTGWEADFLNAVLQQGYPLTLRQRAVVVQMADKYLPAAMAHELRQQWGIEQGA